MDSFLGVVSSGGGPWVVTVSVNGHPVEFQIDSGAEVTAIPSCVFQQLQAPPLHPAERSLKGPTQSILPVRGRFKAILAWRDETVTQDVFVLNDLLKPLLGRPAIEALALVLLVRIGTIAGDRQCLIVHRFPQLFQGLGRAVDEYTIQLKPGAVLFALPTPRRVAIPLLKRVKTELENMEKLGVISRIDTPTDWCAGMVVVPKTNGRVRICVDLTQLNKNVRRERHPLPAGPPGARGSALSYGRRSAVWGLTRRARQMPGDGSGKNPRVWPDIEQGQVRFLPVQCQVPRPCSECIGHQLRPRQSHRNHANETTNYSEQGPPVPRYGEPIEQVRSKHDNYAPLWSDFNSLLLSNLKKIFSHSMHSSTWSRAEFSSDIIAPPNHMTVSSLPQLAPPLNSSMSPATGVSPLRPISPILSLTPVTLGLGAPAVAPYQMTVVQQVRVSTLSH